MKAAILLLMVMVSAGVVSGQARVVRQHTPRIIDQETLAKRCVSCALPDTPKIPDNTPQPYSGVLISVTVAKSGAVSNIKVLKGDPLLSQTAVDAASRWRFTPSDRETITSVNIKFDLPPQTPKTSGQRQPTIGPQTPMVIEPKPGLRDETNKGRNVPMGTTRNKDQIGSISSN